VIFFEDRREK